MKKSVYCMLYVGVAFAGSLLLGHDLHAQTIITPQNLMDDSQQDHHWASDSVEKVDIPVGLYGWRIDPRFGDRIPMAPDTVMHHFQNDAFTDGRTGHYLFLGNYGSPRESRLFAERLGMNYDQTFIFGQPYDFFVKQPGELFYTNTKSPITNLTYHECGNKQNGEDRITALFAVNSGKKLGMGFKLDYLYGRGYYPSQQTAHFNGTLYASYLSDRYEMHTQYYANHLKTAENGGIENDDYVTRPEAFPTKYGTADMPMRMQKTWNKLNVNTFFLTHRYNFGMTRYVDEHGEVVRTKGAKMPFQVLQNSVQTHDSLAVQTGEAELDSADWAGLKAEFIPVASVVHTLRLDHNNRRFLSNWQQRKNFSDYFADFYLPGDSANDYTQHLHVANTVALELREGFNKWAKAGMRLFVRHDFNRYELPDLNKVAQKEVENHFALGAQLLKRQGRYLHYDLLGEIRTSGKKWGEFNVEGRADLNLPFRKDTLRIEVDGRLCNQQPTYYYRHYHGRNAWWDKSLDDEFRAKVGATLRYRNTSLRFDFESIQNYAYFAERLQPREDGKLPLVGVDVRQSGKNIQLLSATLGQNFKWGIFHWDTELTGQLSSDKDVLPLPAFNGYTNMYIDFRIAKVLHTELGADLRYFTEYYAPTYSPMIGQFCVQDAAQRVKLGNYPTVNVYANFHLKQTRFYVMASHVNYKSGSGYPFVIPHYPMNQMVLRLGISWNFFN